MIALPIVALALVVLPLGAVASPGAVEPPSPASGHAEVVAQGLVTFGDGPWHWLLIPHQIGPQPTAIDSEHPSFLAVTGPAPVLASDADGPLARVAPGEAIYRGNPEPTELVTLGGAAGSVQEIAMIPGAGSSEFTPGPGTRDVDLVRDVLAMNEALILHSDVSAFVVVTAGTVNAAGTTVAAGSAVAFTGDVILINTAAEPAVVLAAVVGPALSAIAAPATSTSAPAPTGDGSGNTGAPATTSASTSTSTTSTTTSTSTTTTTEPPTDTDSDGLSDTEETELGTNPNVADTDLDGLPDGREVNAMGTNPLDTDTDSDALTDGLEFDHSCDPNVPDTDSDGLGDAFEANSGFSECAVADTDGDRADDQAEFSSGTDPRDPACHPGVGSVCV